MVQSGAIMDIADRMPPPMELTEYVWFRVNIMRKAYSNVSIDDAEVRLLYFFNFLDFLILSRYNPCSRRWPYPYLFPCF